MPTPYLGLGVVNSVDAKTIDLVVNCKPPTRERVGVEVATLDSTLITETPGIEMASEYTFRLLRDPDDTDQTSLWTLFGSKATVSCIITYTDGTPATWTFNGWVKKIEHATVEHDQHLAWDVTISRNGAITVG